MKSVSPWLQNLLVFEEKHQLVLVFVGISLVAIVILLVAPIFVSLPIPDDIGEVIVYRPVYVIPDGKYTLSIRAKNPDTTFKVTEGNRFVIIRSNQSFEGPTPRADVTIQVASPQVLYEIKNAEIAVEVASPHASQTTTVSFPIFAFMPLLSLFSTVALSLPIMQILSFFWGRLRHGKSPSTRAEQST